MKTHIITFTLILTSSLLFAQKSFFVGLQGNYGKTSLRNKEDTQADDRLNYQNTFKANYGLLLGYKFHNKVGIRSITTGIGFNTISQKYVGKPYNGEITTSKAITELKYMKIPIELNIAFVREERFIPFATIGVHVNYLRNYTDNFSGVSYSSLNGKEDIFYKGTKDSYYYQFDYIGLTTGSKINKGYYQTWNLGATAGVGAEVIISDIFSTSLQFKCEYGITDAEYKGKITYSGSPIPSSPWELNYAKYFSRGQPVGVPNNPGPRPATHTINLGLQLSFYFHFDGGLLNNNN